MDRTDGGVRALFLATVRNPGRELKCLSDAELRVIAAEGQRLTGKRTRADRPDAK